jgi:hypothetical protein
MRWLIRHEEYFGRDNPKPPPPHRTRDNTPSPSNACQASPYYLRLPCHPQCRTTLQIRSSLACPSMRLRHLPIPHCALDRLHPAACRLLPAVRSPQSAPARQPECASAHGARSRIGARSALDPLRCAPFHPSQPAATLKRATPGIHTSVQCAGAQSPSSTRRKQAQPESPDSTNPQPAPDSTRQSLTSPSHRRPH